MANLKVFAIVCLVLVVAFIGEQETEAGWSRAKRAISVSIMS